MNIIKQFDKKQAEDILNKYLDRYNITVYQWSVTSCGRAYYKDKRIKIPKPTNIDRFSVCLHEIKHIIDGRIKPRYISEFRCDKFALDIINDLGWDTEYVRARMKWHVLSRVAMATNRGLKKIDPLITNYYNDIDFDDWYRHKIFVSPKRQAKKSEPKYWDIDISKREKEVSKVFISAEGYRYSETLKRHTKI